MTRRWLALTAAAAVCGFAWLVPDAKPAPVPRTPWVMSKVVGSPEPPPPYMAARVFPNATFKQPLLFVQEPGGRRFFVGERRGALYSLENRPDAKPQVALDIRHDLTTLAQRPDAKGIDSLYALAFHPKFAENRYCYVCYTLQPADRKVKNLPDGSRISRFTVTDTNPPRLDPASEEIVLSWVQGGHNGCDLHFGPDGFLYMSTGDAADPNPPDPENTGQDCSDLLSCILRLDVDRKEAGQNYAVPKDNPFVGLKGIRPEIWAFGFRNPWRMSFDRQTGDLWVGDVGWELWEMIHKVEKGGNYGWSIVEGRQSIKPEQKAGPTPVRPPVIELPHTIAASVTGGYFYRGKKFPELAGAYIFGDWETRRIWAARIENGRVKQMPELVKPNIRVVSFGEDADGELYFLDYDAGTIHTLERNSGAGQNNGFPRTLSATGLFALGQDHAPAAGVVPFTPNAKQWQDGAVSSHFLALPGTSSITLYEKPRPIPGQVYWHNFRMHFPKDAVLAKELTLAGKRIETQILHFDGEDWHGYNYAWRDDQSDADLVPAEGAEKVLAVAERDGSKREHVWNFHSRTQCLTCHNSWAEYALAFNVGQLANPGRAGASALDLFKRDGFIRHVHDEPEPGKPPFTLPIVSNPSDAKRNTVEARARGYLHANCAHCHRFGGGGSVSIELDSEKKLADTGLLDIRPKQGDFGIPDAKLISPGEPNRSVLYYRMAKFGRGRMPHLGSEMPDADGLKLVEEWIYSLGKEPRKLDSIEPLDTALRSPFTALPWARVLRGSQVSSGDRVGILAAAGKLQAGPVRDLFEGYLPPDPKGRKLGSNPRPESILRLTGDAKRGETIYSSKEQQCANCHKLGDKGVSLGPELTAIGKTRSKVELLESLLEPSQRIEPQFTPYSVKTTDGRAIAGLLVKRDAKQVVIRDVQNKEIPISAEDVETVQASRVSLMPDGLLAALTPQEAADLLEFLATRK